MTNDQSRYSITELADLAGVTPRTVRFYLSQGLLPSPGTVGPGAKYTDEHLERLRVIRRLQRHHLPLAEIRERLSGLSDLRIGLLSDEEGITDELVASDVQDSALDYIRRILAPAPARPASLLKRATVEAPRPAPAMSASPPLQLSEPAPPPPPSSIERSQWERITLATDIELHVRRPLSRPQSRKVDRLVSIARELLEEDPS